MEPQTATLQFNPYLRDMIELSKDTLEADTIISEETGYQTAREKKAYLCSEFRFKLCGSDDVSSPDDIRDYNDYMAMLAAIIDRKWR